MSISKLLAEPRRNPRPAPLLELIDNACPPSQPIVLCNALDQESRAGADGRPKWVEAPIAIAKANVIRLEPALLAERKPALGGHGIHAWKRTVIFEQIVDRAQEVFHGEQAIGNERVEAAGVDPLVKVASRFAGKL